MSGLLASVCSVAEAEIALDSYANIIDCKNPHQGALGALPPLEIARIVEHVRGERPVSATTGDLDGDPRRLKHAARVTADCGVDYIKFGLFDADSAASHIRALRDMTNTHQLIAVCFADRFDPRSLLPLLAANGYRGVMIDTADKQNGSLTDLWTIPRLAAFVQQAQGLGLLCGLAGRLGLRDIPSLLPLQADYLGFRGALCGGNRRHALDRAAMNCVRDAFEAGPMKKAPGHEALALH